MCIYYGKQNGLKYSSSEHIFPATIGGLQKLPKGYVSDEANQYFSKLESRMVTESFIGFEKMFWGPGKRGTQKPGRMPITLFVTDDNRENLGFSFKGKPLYIPQIIVSKDLKQLNLCRDEVIQTNEDIINLINKIKNFKGKYTIISNKPQLSAFLIGLYEDRLYIAVDDASKVLKFIEYINQHVTDKIDFSKAKHSKSEGPQIAFKMSIDLENDARVFAKVAINVIANTKGVDYLDNPVFNEFKDWIMGERNDKYAQMPRGTKLLKSIISANKNVHYCIIMNVDSKLVAFVSFYNHWTMGFAICESFDKFFNSPFIYLCDWQKQEEYILDTSQCKLYLQEAL